MTINTQTNVVVAQGNGATNPFSYNFLIPLAADAEVIYTDATGASTILNPAQYTITGIGNPNGGTVTYPIVGSPIASGTTLTIARILPLVQATTLSNQGNQYPTATEGALDYEMMALQQVSNQSGRALVAPITDATAPGPLPGIAQRANSFLGFDGSGNPIAGAVSGAPVSTAMQPVVAAATVAAALALLGGVSISALVNWTAVADANAALGVGLYTYTWTTLTASRTATLRAASAYTPGQQIIIEDGSGNASPAILITAIINPAPGTDTIVGASTVSSANGRLVLVCDGISKFYGYRLPSTGTLAGQSVALDSAAKLPAVDGSQLTGIASPIVPPGGRLTLTTATPVLTSTVLGATSILYSPYTSQFVPIYNGTAMVMTDIGGELTNILANSATGKAGPAAAANNSNYDLFVWNDAGTPRLTRGPLWTSDTARGTGAGTTELVRVKGVWLNANDITNGPLAQRGTYVGTVRTNGAATVDYQFGALGANGTAGIIGVWNAYNRVNISMFVQDSTDSWAYSTPTIRAANASNTMRVSFISGLAEDGISAQYSAAASHSTTSATSIATSGVGYDSTSAIAAGSVTGKYSASLAGAFGQSIANLIKASDLGFHFVQALEHAAAAGAWTWYGDNGAPTTFQSGLNFNFRA